MYHKGDPAQVREDMQPSKIRQCCQDGVRRLSPTPPPADHPTIPRKLTKEEIQTQIIRAVDVIYSLDKEDSNKLTRRDFYAIVNLFMKCDECTAPFRELVKKFPRN